MTRSLSILEQIAEAESEAEIDQILRKGDSYQKATSKTKNRWNRNASRRREELRNANGERV